MTQKQTDSQTAVAQILIVDDHPLVREALTGRIARQADMQVCGEAADVDEAMSQVRKLDPDLVVVDIALKNGNGIDLIKQITSRNDNVKMLVSSMFDESLYADRALNAGAMGYISKQEAPEELIDAIRQVLRGNVYVSSQMADILLSRSVGGKTTHKHSRIDQLSNRELEVFQLIGQGLTTGQIANRLLLSVHTIDTYREKLKTKLALKTGTQLSRYAMQWVLENG